MSIEAYLLNNKQFNFALNKARREDRAILVKFSCL